MKLNKWTLSLAALGVVSLGSVARADEAQMSAVQSALASTVISGYVDTSLEWQVDPDKQQPSFGSWGGIPFRTDSKRNGFNLNVVKLSIEKAMDESEWASGYKVDLLFGPDAVNYNLSANASGGSDPDDEEYFSDVGIKQAYVAMRTPIGNGVDWKFGVFDTIIGYESFDACNNPNFTRSRGYSVEPTQHTGVLGTYRLTDSISFSAGLANTHFAGINTRDTELTEDDDDQSSEWRKTWMTSMSITAPDSAGALSGSTFYLGAVGGFANHETDDGEPAQDQVNFYAGATFATPVSGLRFGAAIDFVDNLHGTEADGGTYEDDVWNIGLYASYQATEKMSLHFRGEYGNLDYENGLGDSGDETMWSLTGTLQYNLWANVVSRLELRYDDYSDENDGGNDSPDESYFGVFANFIYKF